MAMPYWTTSSRVTGDTMYPDPRNLNQYINANFADPKDSVMGDADSEESPGTAHILQLGVDYGIKTSSVAYRLVEVPIESGQKADARMPLDPETCEFTAVKDVPFGPESSANQAVAWDEHDNFYYGKALVRAISEGKVDEEDVIELWKLAMYTKRETSNISATIKKQLGKRTMEQLVTRHLKQIIADVKESLNDMLSQLGFEQEDIDDMPVQLFIGVPQMWDRLANKRMVNAASAAGDDRVELVLEPQAAAGFYANFLQSSKERLSLGTVIILADLGGGTGDFVSFRVTYDSDNRAQLRLEQVGFANGELCGSEWVNQQSLKWLAEHADVLAHGGIEALCKKLNLRRAAFNRQASRAFDRTKHAFVGTEVTLPEPMIVVVGNNGEILLFHVFITPADVIRMFRPVIKKVVDMINEQLVEAPTASMLVLPGGFGQSEYLRRHLSHHFSPRLTIPRQALATALPVAHGALHRYRFPQIRGMPKEDSFGISQDEEYDATIHPDAIEEVWDRVTMTRVAKTIVDHGIIVPDFYEPKIKIVPERWKQMTISGTQIGAWANHVCCQQQAVPIEKPVLRVHVSLATKPMDNHEAMRDSATGKYKKHVIPYEKLRMNLGDLRRFGFPIMSTKRGKILQFLFQVVLRTNGAEVKISIRILRPGWHATRTLADNNFVWEKADVTVVDSMANPNPRGNLD